MKKLMIAALALGASFAANAMAVDWSYSGVAADAGANVYLILGSEVASFANAAAVAAAALDMKDVVTKSDRTGSTYVAAKTTQDAKLATKSTDYYFVIVNAAEDGYKTTNVYPGTYIYDPDNQESKPGTTKPTFTQATYQSFGGGDVPEPTSAMLVLLGVAGLALKRKRA